MALSNYNTSIRERRQPGSNMVNRSWTVPGWNAGGSTQEALPERPEIERFNMPARSAPEQFVTPEYDEGKVKELQQKAAAPGLRTLRDTVQKATSKTYENPNVKRMIVREALAGMGEGVENIMKGAYGEASQQYGQQYGREYDAAMKNYSARQNYLDALYNDKMMAEQMRVNEENEARQRKYEDTMDQYMQYLKDQEEIQNDQVPSSSGINVVTSGIPIW